MKDFTHLDEHHQAAMVDVSEKKISLRTAVAQSIVVLPEEVMQKFTDGDIQTKKGSVFQTAIIAGIMAAKKKEIKKIAAPASAQSQQRITSVYFPEKGKKTQMLQGSPADAAKELVKRLREEARAL